MRRFSFLFRVLRWHSDNQSRDILRSTLAYAHRSVIPEIGLRLRTDLTRIGVRTDTPEAEHTKYVVNQGDPASIAERTAIHSTGAL
jgi:hypothetical protein